MLQFTIISSPRISHREQAEIAVNAGCQWIELDTKGLSDSEIENIAEEIIPTCREAGVILIFKHHDILVDKLRVHGVNLSYGDRSAKELRDKLGGHVIIGVEYSPGLNFAELKQADVDYIVVDDATPALISDVESDALACGFEVPIVAAGHLSSSDIHALYEAGAAGFNINIDSLVGPDYTASLSQIIRFCQNLRG